MIVVDTNVLAYLVIVGEHTPYAERLRMNDQRWMVPALFTHEWLNAITLHVRHQVFSRDEAIRRYRRGLALVNVSPEQPAPSVILNLHLTTGRSSYDCQFIAHAMRLRTKLITLDTEILEGAADVAVSLKTY